MRRATYFVLLALISCVPVVGLAAVPVDSSAVRHAPGEFARTLPAAAEVWRVPAGGVAKVVRVTREAPRPDEVQALHRRNADGAFKRVQIGLARALLSEGEALAAEWEEAGGGDRVAQLEVRSMGAAALRVGLDVAGLDPAIELRFGGSRSLERPLARITVAEAQRLLGDDGLYWTPSTDGEAQRIEVSVPAGAEVPAALSLPRLSHEIVTAGRPIACRRRSASPAPATSTWSAV